jgi:hypothetical protein
MFGGGFNHSRVLVLITEMGKSDADACRAPMAGEARDGRRKVGAHACSPLSSANKKALHCLRRNTGSERSSGENFKASLRTGRDGNCRPALGKGWGKPMAKQASRSWFYRNLGCAKHNEHVNGVNFVLQMKERRFFKLFFSL